MNRAGGEDAAADAPLQVLAQSRAIALCWKVHILDCVATDRARMPAGVLLIPGSTVPVAGVARPRGCGQLYEDRDCMLPAGIALGEVMVASVGRGVALERSSLTCWSTIARACFMVGVIGAACLLSLLCWLSWSDIVSSDRGWDGCEERRKRGCRGGPGGRCSEKESEESRVWYSKYVGCFIRKKEEGRR